MRRGENARAAFIARGLRGMFGSPETTTPVAIAIADPGVVFRREYRGSAWVACDSPG